MQLTNEMSGPSASSWNVAHHLLDCITHSMSDDYVLDSAATAQNEN